MTNVSSYNFLRQPQFQGVPSQNFDWNPYTYGGLQQQPGSGYTPPEGPQVSQTPYQDALLKLYGQAPTLDQYQPSRARNIWGGIASGIVGGFGGAPMGAQVGQQIRYGPYMRAQAEYQSRLDPLAKQAQMEAQTRYQQAVQQHLNAQSHRLGTQAQHDVEQTEASQYARTPQGRADLFGRSAAARPVYGGGFINRATFGGPIESTQVSTTPEQVARIRNEGTLATRTAADTAAEARRKANADDAWNRLVYAQDKITSRFNTAQANAESRFQRHEQGLTERSTNKKEPKLTQQQIAQGRKNVAQLMVQKNPEYAKYFWDDGSGKLKNPEEVKSSWESFKSTATGGRLGKSETDQEKERQAFLKEYLDNVKAALGTDYLHLIGVKDPFAESTGTVNPPTQDDEDEE